MRKTSCFKRRFMTKALILSIVLVIVWGSSSIVGASPRVDKQLGQLITLTMKETSVINIIQEIRKSTDYRFLFQVDDLKNMNKEEFVVSHATIKEVMDKLVDGTNLTYTFRSDAVVVLALKQQAAQIKSTQKFSLKGRVFEKTDPGKGIPFASVFLPQLGIGTVTKADGTFEIKNLDPDVYKVEISSLGFETLQTTINLNSKTPANLKFGLVEANFRLDEVVITATNSKAGASTSSSISRLAMDHMQASSLSDIMQLLPGATVSKPDLTSVSTLSLRGGASLGTAVIMDGAPISNNSICRLPSATRVPIPVGVNTPPKPAPPERIRSAKVPCGLNSISSSPLFICSLVHGFVPICDTITFFTCLLAINCPHPLSG